jgi:hypothetical protein
MVYVIVFDSLFRVKDGSLVLQEYGFFSDVGIA